MGELAVEPSKGSLEGDRPETNLKHSILKTPNSKLQTGAKATPPKRSLSLESPKLKRRGIGIVIGALEGTLKNLEVLGDIDAIAKPIEHL